VRNRYVEPLDKKNIPNVVANLVDNLKSVPYDKKRDYTVPWQSGAVGIGYNPKKTGRKLNSFNDLFDPAFKGRVTMLNEAYDSSGVTMLAMGVNPTEATIDQILAAIDKIQQAADAGQFRRFTGNDYSTDLAKGNIWVAHAYSGDIVQLQSDNPDLEFIYPDEGAMLFTDNMMVPAKAAHVYAAETMMNFVYEPEIAAKLAIYVNYLSPCKGVKEIVDKTDPDIANNPLIFPSDEIRSKLYAYPALSDADERTMKEAMAKVTGA
jgi:spermidine/putrescine transport system substrate-binding protein